MIRGVFNVIHRKATYHVEKRLAPPLACVFFLNLFKTFFKALEPTYYKASRGGIPTNLRLVLQISGLFLHFSRAIHRLPEVDF